MITCPRRSEYLSATISNIEAAGGADWPGSKFLFVDGDEDELKWKPPASWTVVYRGSYPAGNVANTLRVFEKAAKADIPYVLFFEDDLIFTKNAVQAMAEIEVPPDCWALQFCDLRGFGDMRSDKLRTFRQLTRNHDNEECDPGKACTLWGDQALKVPQWMVERIAQSSAPQRWASKKGADVLLTLIAMEQSAAPFLGVVAPSLVKHVGFRSLCNDNRRPTDPFPERSCRNFPGTGFDALSLL